jgi:hypothetical protein
MPRMRADDGSCTAFLQIIAPTDNMRSRDCAKFFGLADPDKPHEVFHGIFVSAPRARV